MTENIYTEIDKKFIDIVEKLSEKEKVRILTLIAKYPKRQTC